MGEIWNKYDLTAARQHASQRNSSRWPKGKTIDIHSHALIPAAAELVRPFLKQAESSVQSETITLGKKQGSDRYSRLTGIDERLSELDRMGIHIQIVKPAPNQCYYDIPTEVGIKAARLVNDGIAEFVSKEPKRFAPFGTVPLPNVEAAIAELEHISKLGFKGIQILTNVVGRELSDPAFETFWAKAEALRTLVVIHPTGYTEPQRLTRFYFNNVIGNPLDTTVAVHHLIFDGVLERYPDLRILAVHGGGYLPAYHGRIDHAWGARSDSHGSLPNPPSYYLRKFYFDTVVFTTQQLEYLVRLFGPDQILMGTDYPYDMGEYDPVSHICDVESFSSETVSAIAGDNARRLLNL